MQPGRQSTEGLFRFSLCPQSQAEQSPGRKYRFHSTKAFAKLALGVMVLGGCAVSARVGVEL